MGIYKRGNVLWIRYADLSGRVQRESTCSDKYRVAEALLIKRKNAVKEGKQPIVKKIKNHNFTQLATEYERWAERQRAFKSKKHLINQLMNEFANLPLRRFNSMLLEQYQTARIHKGNKPATVNRLIATLKHMFTKAVEWDMVEEETLKRIRKVKFLEENNRRLKYLSKEQCSEFINSCEPHLRPIIITALNTGMRKGEILNLRWDNVDLRHGFILLDITKNGERREIPINGTLKSTLKSITRRLDVPYVFYDKDTLKPYGDVKRSFHTACRRTKIQDFRFHDLRHTFASHLVMAGVDITTVKELLGHKTLTMTLRYAHLAPSHKVTAVDVLDNMLNGKQVTQKVTQSANHSGIQQSKCVIL